MGFRFSCLRLSFFFEPHQEETYQEQGKSFVPKYLALLEAGGSDNLEALLKPLGVDFHNPEFWQKGFDEIKELVKRMERLVDESSDRIAKSPGD